MSCAGEQLSHGSFFSFFGLHQTKRFFCEPNSINNSYTFTVGGALPAQSDFLLPHLTGKK